MKEQRTPAGYGALPYPVPPHAEYNNQQRKRSNTWIIVVVLIVLGLPALLVVLGAVGFVLFAVSAEPVPQNAAPVAVEHTYPETVGSQEVLPFEQWRCIRVIDGDTIEVQHMGDKSWVERVRLLCVNTPDKAKPGYEEANKALESLVLNKQVATDLDPKHDKRDSFGRVLAYVIIMVPEEVGVPGSGGDVNVNVEMVRLGHSVYWTQRGASSMYDAEFTEAAARD